MTRHDLLLGYCPNCHHAIPWARVLISYRCDGVDVAEAECPGCGDIVAPE